MPAIGLMTEMRAHSCLSANDCYRVAARPFQVCHDWLIGSRDLIAIPALAAQIGRQIGGYMKLSGSE